MAYVISLMFAKLLNVIECFSAFAAEAFAVVGGDDHSVFKARSDRRAPVELGAAAAGRPVAGA